MCFFAHASLLLLFLTVRRELFLPMPMHEPVQAVMVSILFRVAIIIYNDFGFVVSMAPPMYFGSQLWLTCVAFPWILMFIGIVIPLVYAEGHFIDIAIPQIWLWTTSCVLLCVFVLSATIFFSVGKRDDLFAAFTRIFETRAQYSKRVYWDDKDEKHKALGLVQVHASQLRLFADEASQWLDANWHAWESAPPVWFNERWKRSLPNCVLSRNIRRILGGKHRRQSSLTEQFKNAVSTE